MFDKSPGTLDVPPGRVMSVVALVAGTLLVSEEVLYTISLANWTCCPFIRMEEDSDVVLEEEGMGGGHRYRDE